MPAVEINAIEPVTNALSTQEGWIGLLLGLLGREGIRYTKRLISTLRGEGSE